MQKKLTILVMLLLFISWSNVFSQEYEYVPFPDSGAIWSEYYSAENTWDGSIINVYERFCLPGEDTVINRLSYKKLYMFYEKEFNANTARYVGGIREDQNKRVYFKGKEVILFGKPTNLYGFDEELLLYDFSLSVGDTLYNGNVLTGEDLVVTAIDTILIGNSFRKKYEFKQFWVEWIEGIGNLRGLLYVSGTVPSGGFTGDLICFTLNGEELYFYDWYSECFPGGSEIPSIKNEDRIKISQDATDSGEQISFDFGECRISTIQIFNSNGRLVKQYNINEKNLIIPRRNYFRGVYLYRASDKEGKAYSGKFIVH